MLRLEPGLLMLSIGIINVPFYAMEMKHMICSGLKITVGEIGPVEGNFFSD